MKLPFVFDESEYLNGVRAVGALSRLFSDNDVPYLDSRVVERLFISSTAGRDLSREDKSFDVVVQAKWGIGVKTFIGKGPSKVEKIAEFNKAAGGGIFNSRSHEQVARTVGSLRNIRLRSDMNELGLEIGDCFYHCLVRCSRHVFVHHEAMRLIDVDAIRPLGRGGRVARKWEVSNSVIHFTDGITDYAFNRSKSVLSKRFVFSKKSKKLKVEVLDNPLSRIMQWTSKELGYSIRVPNQDAGSTSSRLRKLVSLPDGMMMGSPGRDYVVLPLYAPDDHEVHPKSGINQWSAGGRPRKFGEAYIKVPALIHSHCPRFFPPRDTNFRLRLPTGEVSAKICQDNGKALMSNPNHLLGEWLIGVLDPTIPKIAFSRTAPRRAPFRYKDLERLGKDAIRIDKETSGRTTRYVASFVPLGSYEEFRDHFV